MCNHDDNKNLGQVVSDGYHLGLVDCYLEARTTYEIRQDTAQAVAQTAAEQFIDFMSHLMENCSADDFTRFIESPELTSTDRVICIALFAKHHLPDSYESEEELIHCCPECAACKSGRDTLDELIDANRAAAAAGVNQINPYQVLMNAIFGDQ